MIDTLDLWRPAQSYGDCLVNGMKQHLARNSFFPHNVHQVRECGQKSILNEFDKGMVCKKPELRKF